jgi:hypothetical protein
VIGNQRTAEQLGLLRGLIDKGFVQAFGFNKERANPCPNRTKNHRHHQPQG